MKLTKANVVSSLKKAIGDKVITEDLGLVKEENLYYFEGKASCFFDETCTYFSRLSNTRATVYSFVNFFLEQMELVEKLVGATLHELVMETDWDLDENDGDNDPLIKIKRLD